jgi:hypothetical protein
VISQEGLKMDSKKVKAIVEWPTPKSAFEVRSFHGLASFYKNFIKTFSGICAPLIKCMRKGSFQWRITTQRNFELLKRKVIEKPVLALLDFDKVFQVDCDANGIAIGEISSIKNSLFQGEDE